MPTLELSFQAMAEASPLGMVIWEASGAIRHTNRAFRALLDYSEEETRSLDYWAATAGAQKQREINHLLNREQEAYEKEFLTKDGAHQSVRMSGFALMRHSDPMVFAGVVRPIDPTDRSRGEQALRERTLRRQNELLLQLARSQTISSGDFAAAIREITEVSAQGLAVSRVSVWLYDENKQRIICHDLYELEQQRHSQGVELFANDFPNYFRALAEDRTITADDAHDHPATREFSAVYLTPLAIKSMLEAPLRFRGELVGVLCHEHCREQRAWNQEDIVFAGTMGDFVARAMDAAERRRAELALQKMNEELEARVAERARQLAEANELVVRLQKEITESQMAGGFAHEMRNALSSAKILISTVCGTSKRPGAVSEMEEHLNALFLLVRDRLADHQQERAKEIFGELLSRVESLDEIFTTVGNGVDRALKITTQIMNYSRIGQSLRGTTAIDIPQLAKEVIAETATQLAERSIIADIVHSGPLQLLGSEPHFHSVLKNLLLNAADALAEVSDNRARRVTIGYHAYDDRVELSVADNGAGMSEAVKARILEPFFTTKPRTGTGLGMGMVHKIVTLYGGTLEIDTTPNVGTCIRIYWPAGLIAKPVRE